MRRVAIVTHELTGGVGTMTRFVHRVVRESSDYESDVILLATSARDAASMLLLRPRTWIKGPQIILEHDEELSRIHVGSWAAEIEVLRYRPRSRLTALLAEYDILQFVAGTGSWLAAAEEVDRPKCVWVATTNKADRASRAGEGSFLRRMWSARMGTAAEDFEKRGLAMADSILALSPYTASSLRPKISPREAMVAPCGVDTGLFHPPDRAAGISENGYILCVGRLSDARKNIALLLRAYAGLLGRIKSAPRLCLTGGNLPDHLVKLAKELGISDRLMLPGLRSGEALAEIYRNASFFVLSSDEEGLGIVILEAMASGLAVISTDSGGPSSIVQQGVTGFVTPVGDLDALVAAMVQLTASPELCLTLGAAGRRRVEDSFSVSAAGRPFIDQYTRLLS